MPCLSAFQKILTLIVTAEENGEKTQNDNYPGNGAPGAHLSLGRPRSANEGLGYDGSLYVGVVP